VVNLVATPASGYQFVNWTGSASTIPNVNAALTTITLNGNYSIKANFEEIPPIQYKLTISSTAGGSVTTPGQRTFTYDAGTVVSLVPTPASGYRFVNWTGDVATLSCECQSTTHTMNGNYSITANFAFQCLPMVDGGHLHTAGLKSDGTVVAAGLNNYGQCNVGNWTDIVQVAADDYHTAGLKSDGTVVAVGRNYYGECDVDDWMDIIQVSVGDEYTVGLKSDGSVIALG
jgi:hypothetical protein